ncbi:MAG: 2,3-bisphosphoglycerate-independent phosphoglycerate mutase [Candidatus Saccharibacteria bacterium]|nr:2,3-bisphosphoglycerate-independent phosphoglycerate mutase [Candidatus Saccharibacteria bacterium]
MSELKYRGPVVLVVMDGVGLRGEKVGNAVKNAHTEWLDQAVVNYPAIKLEASGEAVGVLAGVMGNSEVGHNALGSGQIIKQGIARIEEVFETGEIWETVAWRKAIENVKEQSNATLHFAGICSDGGVHSDIKHLYKMIRRAKDEGIKKLRVHLVLDGRDVAPQSALKYVDELEEVLKGFGEEVDFRIATGGGRMVFVADRYENDWGMVKAGWEAMVWGKADFEFESARQAIETFRRQDTKIYDQYLPPFVIKKEGQAVGLVKDGDSMIYYNFRADRAIEIAQAFTYEDFPYFDRGTENNRRLKVFFAGMTEYNSDTHVPEYRLVEPVKIKEPLNQWLGKQGLAQLAVAENVKFGHITYYFNGNSYEKAPLEEQIEIASDTKPFNERPWMKAAETTDVLLENLERFKFVRVNYAGGDMVGHFGEMESTMVAVEAIDLQLKRLAKEIDRLGGMMIVTADHGNAEELIDDETGEPKTCHTTNLVPCIFYDNTENKNKYRVKEIADAGITNIAATVAVLLGGKDYPKIWREPLIEIIDL